MKVVSAINYPIILTESKIDSIITKAKVDFSNGIQCSTKKIDIFKDISNRAKYIIDAVLLSASTNDKAANAYESKYYEFLSYAKKYYYGNLKNNDEENNTLINKQDIYSLLDYFDKSNKEVSYSAQDFNGNNNNNFNSVAALKKCIEDVINITIAILYKIQDKTYKSNSLLSSIAKDKDDTFDNGRIPIRFAKNDPNLTNEERSYDNTRFNYKTELNWKYLLENINSLKSSTNYDDNYKNAFNNVCKFYNKDMNNISTIMIRTDNNNLLSAKNNYDKDQLHNIIQNIDLKTEGRTKIYKAGSVLYHMSSVGGITELKPSYKNINWMVYFKTPRVYVFDSLSTNINLGDHLYEIVLDKDTFVKHDPEFGFTQHTKSYIELNIGETIKCREIDKNSNIENTNKIINGADSDNNPKIKEIKRYIDDDAKIFAKNIIKKLGHMDEGRSTDEFITELISEIDNIKHVALTSSQRFPNGNIEIVKVENMKTLIRHFYVFYNKYAKIIYSSQYVTPSDANKLKEMYTNDLPSIMKEINRVSNSGKSLNTKWVLKQIDYIKNLLNIVKDANKKHENHSIFSKY